jgi:hypothetical protein
MLMHVSWTLMCVSAVGLRIFAREKDAVKYASKVSMFLNWRSYNKQGRAEDLSPSSFSMRESILIQHA